MAAPTSGVSPWIKATAAPWERPGSRLAGIVGVADEGIIIYHLESGTYERLTDYGQWPVWLPDARRILFVTGGDSFYVIDVETKDTRLLRSERWDVLGPPRLTADGRDMVYTRRTTEGDIWLAVLE